MHIDNYQIVLFFKDNLDDLSIFDRLSQKVDTDYPDSKKPSFDKETPKGEAVNIFRYSQNLEDKVLVQISEDRLSVVIGYGKNTGDILKIINNFFDYLKKEEVYIKDIGVVITRVEDNYIINKFLNNLSKKPLPTKETNSLNLKISEEAGLNINTKDIKVNKTYNYISLVHKTTRQPALAIVVDINTRRVNSVSLEIDLEFIKDFFNKVVEDKEYETLL